MGPPFRPLDDLTLTLWIAELILSLDLKHITSAERLPFSLAYFGSLALTLYFSIGVSRQLYSPHGLNSKLTPARFSLTLGHLLIAPIQDPHLTRSDHADRRSSGIHCEILPRWCTDIISRWSDV